MREITLDDSEIIEALRDVERSIDPLMVEAASMGADMIAARARNEHDYNDQSGALTNSIQRGAVGGSFLDGTLEAEAAAGQPYGFYLEHGTDDHKVVPRHRQALRWPVEGGFAFSRGHVVSGIEAREFLAKALENEGDAIEEIFLDGVELAFTRAGL